MSPCEVDITFNEICSMFYCRDVSRFAVLWQQSWVTPAKYSKSVTKYRSEFEHLCPMMVNGLATVAKKIRQLETITGASVLSKNRQPQSGWCQKGNNSQSLDKATYWSYLETLTQGRVWNKVVTGLCVCCEWSCPCIMKENSIDPLYIIQNWRQKTWKFVGWIFCFVWQILSFGWSPLFLKN